MPPLKRPTRPAKKAPHRSAWFNAAMEHLESVIKDLARAHDLDDVMHSVRSVARDLMGADGATFVLRDNGYCYYADEDAIGPLWKGQRFPMNTCISGWAMLNDRPAIIPDIYADERIPHDAYRPTFVKSLVMMPVSIDKPVAAIGTYWARQYNPNKDEVAILQVLATITGVAMDQPDLSAFLQAKLAAVSKSAP